jgi:RNA polymerase sigma-70 factor (ECF subfamily)
MTDKEKELLVGCLRGDQAAWHDFVRQYSGLIYHTIKTTFSEHHFEPSQPLVDDLCQDIFLSLLKDDFAELRRFRGDHGCTLASWLRMIAARRTIDHLRKSKFPAELVEEPLENHPAETQERLLDNEQSQLLAKAVEGLPPREKIVLDLFFREGLPAKEVAAILRMSIGAVYTQKSRILAKLRETLKKAGS